MSLPDNEHVNDVKVIESVNFCFCINFYLNINDWYIEYENIEIFKKNMKKNLSKPNTNFKKGFLTNFYSAILDDIHYRGPRHRTLFYNNSVKARSALRSDIIILLAKI